MKEKRPVLVTIVGDLNFLSIFTIVMSFFPKLIKMVGIYTVPINTYKDILIRISLVIILIIITYGFLGLKKWGYWLMIAYDVFFIVLGLIFYLKKCGLSYYSTDPILGVIGLTFTMRASQYFNKKNEV